MASLLNFTWDLYTTHLVYYAPDGWIARAARTFRILAALLLLPFALLTLLDVTSYVIARTLGAIDATQASTSDRDPLHAPPAHTSTQAPSILVSQPTTEGASLADPTPISEDAPSLSSTSISALRGQEARLRAVIHPPHRTAAPGSLSVQSPGTRLSSLPQDPNAYFFTPHEEQSLALSGVGVFSPAGTRPPSPVIERRSLAGSMSTSPSATTLNLSSLVEGKRGETAGSIRRRNVQGGAMGLDLGESFMLVEEEEEGRR